MQDLFNRVSGCCFTGHRPDALPAYGNEQAEEMLQVVSSVVQKLSGATPVLYIREGTVNEQLLTSLASEEPISVLVLGVSAGSEGPGQVLSYVLKRLGKLKVPVTIVPGNLSDAEIDAAMTGICRCGTYPRMREAIRRAGRVIRGEERIAAAPPPGIRPDDAARAVPALRPAEGN